ncbi:MAG TPA: methyl-accepting chemotaxis protein [Spirochaetota bacterium]|nr:methyl-accepting chemotaxis protein [Spirochaetota bacterium]
MNFRDIKVGFKLYLSFGIVIGTFISLLAFVVYEMNDMKNIQDEGYKRAADLADVLRNDMTLDELYSVMTDAIINRNLAETEKKMAEMGKTIDEDLKQNANLADTKKEKELARQIGVEYNAMIKIFNNRILPELKRGNAANMAFINQADGEMDPIREKLKDLYGKLSKSFEKEMKDGDVAYDGDYQTAFIMIVIFTVAAVIAGAVLSFIITRFIKTRVDEVGGVASRLSRGDLTGRIDLDQRDEFGVLAKDMNGAMDNLNAMMAQVMAGVQNLAQAVQQVASGNENLSQRTSEQASSLEEIASTIEEATATINQNAENAVRARDLTETGVVKSVEGNKIAVEAVTSITEMNESSKKVADIIAVINEIAFQTNLLALNAAVEAARAGEQGRGFAVVAGEVRNLAQRSGNAAKEIEVLIKDTVSRVQNGTDLVSKTGNALNEITGAAKTTAQIINEIATASQEQKQGINQINNAIAEMDNMTQQNASLVEETASASEEMANQAQELMGLVEKFKLNDTVLGDMGLRKESTRKASGIVKKKMDQEKKAKGGDGNGKKTTAMSAVPAMGDEAQKIKDIMQKDGFDEF